MHVGIDLGTTYSVVSKFDKGTNSPVVLKNSFGKDTTPSVVCIENGEITHGSDAKDEFAAGNYQAFAFYKTNMGDPDYIKYADGKEYSAEALSGIFLKKLVEDVSSANGVTIDSAVITVPAYFDEAKRQATINAGKMAGLNVLRIINEPTAAIIAYGLTSDNKTRNVMVYDLGGGTFDVTIAKVQGSNVTVLGTDGNHSLGGQNWDEAIKEYFFKLFSEQYGYDPREDDDKIEKEVMAASEKIKQRLSAASTANFNVRCGGNVGNYSITREEFENLTMSLMDTTGSLINNTLRTLKMTWKDIDETVLVGGSSRMPMVADYIEKQCGKRPLFNVNLDTIVSSGAAIQAELEVNAKTGQITQLRSISKATNQSSLITISNTGIQDATSHSLGMISYNPNTNDMENSIIIPKNSPYNKSFKRDYLINEPEMDVYVLQGEMLDPHYCNLLFKYVVSGMPQGKENNITVYFSYTNDGVVYVEAKLDNSLDLTVEKKVLDETIDDIIIREKKIIEESKKKDLKIVVTSSGCDDIGEILRKMNVKYEDFDSQKNPYDCDILFFNCCTHSDINAMKLNRFVHNGGCLYASCYADETLHKAFPLMFMTSHSGEVCSKRVQVCDGELREVLGDHIQITFDTIWAELHSANNSTTILRTDGLIKKPIMVCAKYGKGKIFYTCFHNHAQTSKEEEALLQLLILKELGSVSGSSVHQMGARLGIDIEKMKRDISSRR